MQINYLKNKIFRNLFKILSFFVFAILFANTAYATETYVPSESIVIGEFIYNDDYTPTTDDCTISIYSPAGATLVNNVTMTDDATGWHYYSYTTPVTEGKYPTFITCGTLVGGDLLKLDKSFIVKAPNVTDSSIASAVWSNGTRSLTTFGTLVSDVWNNGTRTLSSFGALASDVWNNTFAPTRQLTTKNIAGGGSLATESYIDSSQATVISEIQTNRTLISALNNVSAADVWAAGTRTLTSGVDLSNTSVSAIWDKATSSLSTSGSIGKLIVDNLDTQISSRGTSNLTAGDVWASATRTLSSTGVDAVSAGVWANAGRTLTSYGNDITAADVWNTLSSTLTTVGSIGKQLQTNSDAKTSDVLTAIAALNNISATDVWAAGTRTLTSGVDLSNTSVSAIWDKATSSLSTSGSIGKKIVDNLDAQVSTRGTSNITAADVWASATRTLSTTGTDAVSTAVWANATRTLSNYGNDITANDVWNVLSSSLTTVGSIGKQLATNVDAKTSDVLTAIAALNNISATDVWAYGTRSVNSGTTSIDSGSVSAIWDKATSSFTTSGSVGKKIADNLDTQISSRGTSNLTAGDVWASATRTLSSTGVDAVSAGVWANAGRTLTSYGNDITAADVWNVLTSAITTTDSIGLQIKTNIDAPISAVGGASNWTVKMGNVERIQAGYVYRTKVFILNSSATPTAPFATPTVTLYDTNRNTVVSGVPMTLISTGVYEYTYTVANSAVQGLWETVVSSEVESGKTIQTNDYWEVSGSPAQVIINSVTANSLSSILANITITNEGLSGYEYDYEWCIVSNLNNNCGGNDDVYYASAAKFINPSESWNTNLSATAITAGTYYFKLVVHFGTDSSSASRVFTVSSSSSGGGGGGGGSGGGNITTNTTTGGACNGADFNKNKIVDSVDFSILLYFWKRVAPFKNPCVDINVDNKVDSVDFSIMLFQWGKKSI